MEMSCVDMGTHRKGTQLLRYPIVDISTRIRLIAHIIVERQVH